MSGLRGLSLRTRLALQLSAAVAVLALLYAGGVWIFARASASEQLDARLGEDYEAIEHGFEALPDGGLRWATQPQEDERPTEAPWAEVRSSDGRLLLRRPEASGEPETGSRVLERTYALKGVPYRLRVGRSAKPMEDELARLALLLGGCLVPVVLLAFLAGRWLAGRALAPVGAMTERASAISAENLSERLPEAGADDELGRLARVFNETFARLERSFEALRRFTADASHDFRTPLTALRTVGEVALRERRSPEQYREAIGSMLEECDRLGRLTDDLLQLSRADAGRVALHPVACSLADLARQSSAQLGVLAEERSQRIVLEEDGPSSVHADPRILLRAVSNLLHNAIQHSPAGTTITLRTGSRDEQAWLEVVDQGPGIAPEHQGHVFERFYRVDASRQGPGSGLGLAIAKWAVEASRGRVALESAVGQGSVFRITVPAAAGSH